MQTAHELLSNAKIGHTTRTQSPNDNYGLFIKALLLTQVSSRLAEYCAGKDPAQVSEVGGESYSHASTQLCYSTSLTIEFLQDSMYWLIKLHFGRPDIQIGFRVQTFVSSPMIVSISRNAPAWSTLQSLQLETRIAYHINIQRFI
jgi:hypothetical protein